MKSKGKEKLNAKKKIVDEEEVAIRAKFMKDKEEIDEDHLYVKKGNTTSKIAGRRLKDKINKIKNIHKSATYEINTEEELLNNEEENGKSTGFYDKFIKRIKNHGKNNSWIQNIFGQEPEQKELVTNVPKVNFFTEGIKSKVQVLRSASNWSVGIGKKENSILQAYYQLIDNSKHYIYIENQFFVSRAFNEEEEKECDHALSDIVQNLIAYHIKERIKRAYYNKEKFRVFVFIPLLPGFPG